MDTRPGSQPPSHNDSEGQGTIFPIVEILFKTEQKKRKEMEK